MIGLLHNDRQLWIIVMVILFIQKHFNELPVDISIAFGFFIFPDLPENEEGHKVNCDDVVAITIICFIQPKMYTSF